MLYDYKLMLDNKSICKMLLCCAEYEARSWAWRKLDNSKKVRIL